MLLRNQNQYLRLYSPILLSMIWLWGSLLLFAFGPYEYNLDNNMQTLLYVCFAHAALYWGYRNKINNQGAHYYSNWTPNKIIIQGLCFTILGYLMSITTSPKSISFFSALGDPENAYDLYLASQGSSFTLYISMFLDPITFSFLVLAAYYWQSLSRSLKILFILILLNNISTGISYATRSGIVFQMITVGGALFAGFYKKRIKLKVTRKIVVFILLNLVMFSLLYYFSIIYSKRSSSVPVTMNHVTSQYPKSDHPITKYAPRKLQPLIMGISIYLTHGYYGLALALEKNFNGIGFGFANSAFLHRNFNRITGSTILDKISYAERLSSQNGYPVGRFWMTIYPWLASDLSFTGTIFLIYLIGGYFAQAWKDSIDGNNPAGVIVFVIMAHLIFSFPINNPLQDGSGLIRTIFWIVIWRKTRIIWRKAQIIG
jgi:hypothetical protein